MNLSIQYHFSIYC